MRNMHGGENTIIIVISFDRILYYTYNSIVWPTYNEGIDSQDNIDLQFGQVDDSFTMMEEPVPRSDPHSPMTILVTFKCVNTNSVIYQPYHLDRGKPVVIFGSNAFVLGFTSMWSIFL